MNEYFIQIAKFFLIYLFLKLFNVEEINSSFTFFFCKLMNDLIVAIDTKQRDKSRICSGFNAAIIL